MGYGRGFQPQAQKRNISGETMKRKGSRSLRLCAGKWQYEGDGGLGGAELLPPAETERNLAPLGAHDQMRIRASAPPRAAWSNWGERLVVSPFPLEEVFGLVTIYT